jgi:primary-amine oxidase
VTEAVRSSAHPLRALQAQEITLAVEALRRHEDVGPGARFAYLGLCDPDKALVRSYEPGSPTPRHLRAVIVPGPQADVIEAIVALPKGTIESFRRIEGVRPALLFEESIEVIHAVHHDPGVAAALARRGITTMEHIQIDPWPAGNFGLAHEEGRRITRCLFYWRERPGDNGYARPIEGLMAIVDMGRAQVLEVIDTGVVPLPVESGSYYPEDNGPLRTDLRPLEITQPEGASFVLEDNHLRWQRFSFWVSMDPLEGLVLHDVTYDDHGTTRPIVYRASVTEMVVPYGDTSPMHNWKNAFDVGEWGLGRLANSLTLGCDCLGEIAYLDSVFADEQGRPQVLSNAICIHEEDYGILWKHVDLHSGRTEVRRSRRLVVSSISTVGNYEYGFFWYFYLDGTISLEVKLTGIMSTRAVEPGEETPFASAIAPGLRAPYHQHLFNVRLDMQVDGPHNTVYEIESARLEPSDENPLGNAFAKVATPLERESQAVRLTDSAASRRWKVVNHAAHNAHGEPVGYTLVPGSTPTLLAHATSSVARRAPWATANLWVTPFEAGERRASGDYPNQHLGGDGLAAWSAQDRQLRDRNVVLWHTFGVTHFPRPEDWPVMPVEYTGFSLVPQGFFDANPALDVAPSGHCHPG